MEFLVGPSKIKISNQNKVPLLSWLFDKEKESGQIETFLRKRIGKFISVSAKNIIIKSKRKYTRFKSRERVVVSIH